MPRNKAANLATAKYVKKTYKRFEIRLRKDTDIDLINYLESKESVNKYLIDLIREDYAKNNFN